VLASANRISIIRRRCHRERRESGSDDGQQNELKKVLDALAKGCRIRIPASGTKQRSLTNYQAKQTVWALAKVSNKKYCNF
jgi:lysophospholipid acyltransferase (LPLAT)-like uncharacterized protein